MKGYLIKPRTGIVGTFDKSINPKHSEVVPNRDKHNRNTFQNRRNKKAITHPIISKNPILTEANNIKPKI